MKPAWVFRPSLSTCNACFGRLFAAWMFRAGGAGNLYCRPCALAIFKVDLPPLLNWPGWSRFKPLAQNHRHNRFVGASR